MQRANSLEKTLKLGKIEDKRRRGQQKMKMSDGITDSLDLMLSILLVIVYLEKCLFRSFPHFLIGLFFSGIELYELFVYFGN